MAIFNEAYINEFFGFGKKKKKEDTNTQKKNDSTNKKVKKYGLITKEEYQKCKSIITAACSKFKILKDYLEFYPETREYSEYCKDGYDRFGIGGINHEDDQFWEDSEDGEEERKTKGFKTDFKDFIDWYLDQLDKAEKEIVNKFSKEFGSNIKFDIMGSSACDYFIIESKKPKEEDEDNSKDDKE